MSNRIDLTQFEKITAGEWSIIRNGNRIDIGVGTSSAYSPIITFTTELAEMVMKIERDVADMNAIASIPNLLAELKKCYAKEDELLKALRIIRDDLNEVIGSLPSDEIYERIDDIKKIRNFANDASQ